jgi:hypothetical protein
MKIYQYGGRLHAIDAAEVIEVQSDDDRRVQSCGGSNSTPARHPQRLLSKTKTVFTLFNDDHVMIPQCSILWPIEDVGTNGYCYGWILNPRLVCVAGVLQVGSLRQLCSSSPTLSY